MLPKMAMPSAPPNSALVSEIAEAAPARSGGADPTIRSVVSVNTGAMPSEKIVVPRANVRSSVDRVDAGEEREAHGGEAPAPRHQEGRARTCRTSAGVNIDPTTKDSAQGKVHSPARKRRHPQHQLQVLGEEQEPAEQEQDRQAVGGQRGAEGRHPEQPQVEQRIRQAQLPAHEQHAHGQPGQDEQHRAQRQAVLGDLLEAEDDRQHRQQRQPGAEQVEPAGVGVPVFGQQRRPHHQQQRHHRHGDQEHRPPPEVLQQHRRRQAARSPRPPSSW